MCIQIELEGKLKVHVLFIKKLFIIVYIANFTSLIKTGLIENSIIYKMFRNMKSYITHVIFT